MREYRQLLLANRAWSQELIDERADFFTRQSDGQKPAFLWIGCSDSRVSPEQMTMTPPGGMFIHRNVANLVNPSDLNLMAALQFAVQVLKVPHIIVCGHYGCGGIRGAFAGGATGQLRQWLDHASSVVRDHADELAALDGEEAKLNRLVEMNVRDQLINLARTDIVESAWKDGQPLWLHGWIYDIRDGHIKPLMELDADASLEEVGRPESVLFSHPDHTKNSISLD